MESHHHAIHAGVLSLVLLVMLPPPSHPLLLVGFVLAVGVGIDFDHFVIARLNSGSWKSLERVLERPSMVFLDQTAIFDGDDVGAIERLVSHVVIASVAAGVLWLVGLQYWASVTAITVLVHLLADGYSTARKWGD